MKLEDLHKLRSEAELLPKIKGRQGCITAIRNRIKFCNMFKTEESLVDKLIRESQKEIDALKKELGLLDDGLTDNVRPDTVGE